MIQRFQHAPGRKKIGTFTNTVHNVSGIVQCSGQERILIKGFTYDVPLRGQTLQVPGWRHSYTRQVNIEHSFESKWIQWIWIHKITFLCISTAFLNFRNCLQVNLLLRVHLPRGNESMLRRQIEDLTKCVLPKHHNLTAFENVEIFTIIYWWQLSAENTLVKQANFVMNYLH